MQTDEIAHCQAAGVSEEGWGPPDLKSVPVRSTSRVEISAAVFCWVAFVVGAVFIPARSIVLGVVAGVSLFGTPLRESDRADVAREFLTGSISATSTATVIFTMTVLLVARGGHLDTGWVAGALASGVAVIAWLLVVLQPTLSA